MRDFKKLIDGYDLMSLLAETQIFASKSEARKMWQAGGLGLNKEKISIDKSTINISDLLNEKYLLIQKGKKNYYLVKTN